MDKQIEQFSTRSLGEGIVWMAAASSGRSDCPLLALLFVVYVVLFVRVHH